LKNKFVLLFGTHIQISTFVMKSVARSNFRISAVFLLLFGAGILPVASQSVYVGQAGAQGNVLKQYIDPAALKKLTENPVDSIWIIDVRTDKTYLGGHIPTARSFPVGTITNRLAEIPQTKYLIIYCTVGANAKIASKYLRKAGYKRYINWGGISRWEWEKAITKDSIP
jgi:rhodanese-related sulfurtransferase